MRRPVARVAVFVLLGAIVNVAVAWAFAKPLHRQHNALSIGGLSINARAGWYLYRCEGPGFKTEYGWPIQDVDQFLGERLLVQYTEYPTTRPPHIDVNEWSPVYAQPAQSERSLSLHIEDYRGWPFHALVRTIKHDLTSEIASLDGRIVHQSGRTWAMSEHDLVNRDGRPSERKESLQAAPLPFRPVWSGFVLNTLIFAGSALLLAVFFGFAQRTTKDMTWHQRMVQATVFLSLGGAIGVATAAIIALCASVGSQPQRYSGTGEEGSGRGPTGWEIWIVHRNEGFGVTRFASDYYVDYGGSFTLSMTPAESLVPAWADRHIVLGQQTHGLAFFAVGWPLRAFQCRFEAVGTTGGWNLHDGIRLPARPMQSWPATSMRVPAIPYRPIWVGLSVNWLFFAILLWLGFVAVTSARRWRRMRRGLCARCGYPVGESATCSECGAAVAPAQTATS
ncbi:MAG: hypothetical protein L0219_04960 [Phycisphaerales bacterium]|nr:hypothetical protein [Phycisphaerales bacterium]MCI0675615.1 hypothetical protein [Phycisphaerales bacterium]